ncbi:MAG: hypothetical protein A3J97_00635 [Spirochaetes bacterium RIFOXYC1_FULL_54_7]|nr:MAG: hypothetical protein A3J97_00635 [Spirochaetes bacterium RIFOXYC1_FULL_54_7]
MDIRMNGTIAEINVTGRNVGEILSELDETAEKAGAIITGIRYNGCDLDAESIAGITGDPADDQGSLELSAEPVTDMKARAIDTLLQLVEAAAAARDEETLEAARNAWISYRSAFDGLYSAEESSFLVAFGEELAGIGVAKNGTGGLGATAAKMASFFSERMAELLNPGAAMLAAAQLFDSIRTDLAEVAVRLQTGKEAEGMHTMVIVVELINKTVRILPDFMRIVPGAARLTIEGKAIGEFYDDFNVVFKELAEAFENKDSVLIGDLAEYEILPRLSAFFVAASAAMGHT